MGRHSISWLCALAILVTESAVPQWLSQQVPGDLTMLLPLILAAPVVVSRRGILFTRSISSDAHSIPVTMVCTGTSHRYPIRRAHWSPSSCAVILLDMLSGHTISPGQRT